MKTCLIHGYCTHLRTPLGRRHPYPHLCFKGINKIIQNNSLNIFIWGINKKVTRGEFLNPLTYLNHYKTEQKLVNSKYLQEKLYKYLENNEIELVISHSMGTLLLLNTLNNIGIPNTLKKIITIQSDIEIDYKVNKDLEQRLNLDLKRDNYYCPRDPALLISSIVNFKGRIGLSGIKNYYTKNTLQPLKGRLNLHTASINDEVFIKELL